MAVKPPFAITPRKPRKKRRPYFGWIVTKTYENTGAPKNKAPWKTGKKYPYRRSELPPEYLVKLTKAESYDIRRILGIQTHDDFALCPSQSRRRRAMFEAKGDFSHSGDRHVCELCRCQHAAGWHTQHPVTGDFYGLGVHTGHLGVGYCIIHERRHGLQRSLKLARHHMKLLQNVGKSTANDAQRLITLEAQEAEKAIEINKSYVMLTELMSKLENKLKLNTMRVRGKFGLEKAGDDDKINSACRLAMTISQMKKNDWQMSAEQYVHVKELQARIPTLINGVNEVLEKFMQMWLAGDDDTKGMAFTTCKDLWLLKVRDFFVTLKTGRTK